MEELNPIRSRALELALAGPHVNLRPPELLERAKAFEDYLRGDGVGGGNVVSLKPPGAMVFVPTEDDLIA